MNLPEQVEKVCELWEGDGIVFISAHNAYSPHGLSKPNILVVTVEAPFGIHTINISIDAKSHLEIRREVAGWIEKIVKPVVAPVIDHVVEFSWP